MNRRTRRAEDHPRVHSCALRPRSPVQTANAYMQRSLSVGSRGSDGPRAQETKMQEKYTLETKHCHGNCAVSETRSLNGDEIHIKVIYVDDNNMEHQTDVRRSCTVEEYMKWMFILHSVVHLDQFNIHLQEKFKTRVAVTSESVVRVTMPLINMESVKQICDDVIKFACSDLGTGLRVLETDLQPEQVDRCTMEHKMFSEILNGRVYCVCSSRDCKRVKEFIDKLAQTCPEKEQVNEKDLLANAVWYKMARLIKLDMVLKENSKFNNLEVKYSRDKHRFILHLNGPASAVEAAEQEFLSLDSRLLQMKCNLSVISKIAIAELQVENLLDEHLLSQSLKCVTRQIKDHIYVYGFNSDSLIKARTEVEGMICEKTSIIQGKLKQRKDLLISHIKALWPGKIVVHINDNGHIHIVGVKQHVNEACLELADLNQGKLQLDDSEKEETDAVNDDRKATNAKILTHSDEEMDRRKEEVQNVQKLTVNMEEDELSVRMKEVDINGGDEGSAVNLESHSMNMKHITEENKEVLDQNEGSGMDSQKNFGEKHGGADNVPEDGPRPVKQQEKDTGARGSGQEIQMKEQTIIGGRKSAADVLSQQVGETNFRVNVKNSDGKNQSEATAERSAQRKEAMTITECINFSETDWKIKQFMLRSEARTFLNEIVNENNVIFHLHIGYERGKDNIEVKEGIKIMPDAGIQRKAVWKTMEMRKMILSMKEGNEGKVGVSGRSVTVVFRPHEIDKEPVTISNQKGHEQVVVVVHAPPWDNIKDKGQEKLMDVLSAFIEATDEAKAEHIILPLKSVSNWPEMDFSQCVIAKTVQDLLLNRSIKRLKTVTLCLNDEDLFDQIFRYTNGCIYKSNAAMKAKRKYPRVLVVSGELDKTKAAVLVNTTSTDLDLSNGKVSSKLLKAAGGKLQKECRKKYPSGITHQEVAVTEGHGLKETLSCEKVFHIALERFHPKRAMESIEAIRSLVGMCLRKASELKLDSIAFPAIGTGVLRYPVDIVAASMFESVERFKIDYEETSLQTVMFVIYPADVDVMEVFRMHEKTLESKPDEKKRKNVDITLDIIGPRENVQRTKSDVWDRCIDELSDSSEICHKDFTGVTLSEYVILTNIYSKKVKELREKGTNLKYEQGILRLTCRRKYFKRSVNEVQEYLDNISKFRFATLAVQDKNLKDVEKMVNHENLNNEVVCILDKYKEIVRIYGESTGKVSEVMNTLKQRLNKKEQHLPNIDAHTNKRSRKGVEEKTVVNDRVADDVERSAVAAVETVSEHKNVPSVEANRYRSLQNEETILPRQSFKHTAQSKRHTVNQDSDELTSKDLRNKKLYAYYDGKLICNFSSNQCVYVYEGDIMQLQGVQALVFCENRHGKVGGVCRQEQEMCGSEHKKEEQLRKNTEQIITTTARKGNFEFIMHVEIPKSLDSKELQKLYVSLFDEVLKKKVSVVALPLLGTEHLEPEECSVILLNEWRSFIHKHKQNIFALHLVLKDKVTTEVVMKVFKNFFDDASKLNNSLEKQETTKERAKSETQHCQADKTVPDETEEDCVICMEKVDNPKKLNCGHQFCTECIDGYFKVKPACPVCGKVCGVITGDQPDGKMEIMKIETSCKGYEGHKTISISYCFPFGNQGENHPRPGAYYRSISRTAFLPDTKEGREICALLKVAFERRLVFTIGTSRTTGEEGVITWNDIHHKTDLRPNTQFGYPDESYLQRVREELEIKGVTNEDIDDKLIQELKSERYRGLFTTDSTV